MKSLGRRETETDLVHLVRGGGFVDEVQRFFDQNLAGHFTQRSSRNILIAWKALKIDLREDVAEGVVRQTEQQVVLAVHLAFEIKADVRQSFSGNRQDLGITEIEKIYSCGNGMIVIITL